MRLTHVLTLAAAATVSLSASAAPAANVDATVNVSAPAIRASYRLDPSQFKAVQGAYALEDGRTLHVTADHRKLYAEVDGEKTEIVPVAPNRFASRDDAMRLAFNSDSLATDVTMNVAVR
ncbi:hypothetical protein NX773_09600 [Massilia solisilvae]|uniref:Gel scht n=1 Tax=Massilia solisilvae TaxID=1811225 RepID=A0ABT2BK00_9BURK|nr:hypothetical protein [Massilia solisilvae]MCS0608415.1 hypothetical protein [Massilia solisilvae]